MFDWSRGAASRRRRSFGRPRDLRTFWIAVEEQAWRRKQATCKWVLRAAICLTLDALTFGEDCPGSF
jgi:hypothetical protein